MHEYAITQNIIEIVSEEARKNKANKIKSITLVIGELAGILDEPVQMYFDSIAQGTICDGAQLVFKKINARLQCKQCNKSFEKIKKMFNCPYCGGAGSLTNIGKEFYIESIEVE